VSAALVLLSLLGASDPCALPEPMEPADPASAALYLEVAEAERAAGERETALAAYQEALRREPTNALARAGLEAVCAPPRPPAEEALARALALLDAGEPKEALAALASEPGTAGTPAAALLAGLAHLALGEDDAAAAALRSARADPETAPAAALYLGILSLRRGEAGEAVGLLDAATLASEARIARRAEALLPHARREGRLLLVARVGADYDSNVDLAPVGAPRPEGTADMALGAVAALTFRPLGPSGPFLGTVGHTRQHRRFYGLDLWGAGGAVGWAVERPSHALVAQLGLDHAALGGEPYLWAPRLELDARGLLGSWVLEARGQLRWESFAEPAFEEYSGLRASGRLGLAWHSEEGRWALGVAYALAHQGARVLPLAALEHGARAELWVRPLSPLRLGLGVAGGWRRHAAFDPALSVRREDGFADAVLTVDCMLTAYWSVQAWLSGRLARSNVSLFSHERWVGGLAVVGSFGLF
jgi:hypothetical protein